MPAAKVIPPRHKSVVTNCDASKPVDLKMCPSHLPVAAATVSPGSLLEMQAQRPQTHVNTLESNPVTCVMQQKYEIGWTFKIQQKPCVGGKGESNLKHQFYP